MRLILFIVGVLLLFWLAGLILKIGGWFIHLILVVAVVIVLARLVGGKLLK